MTVLYQILKMIVLNGIKVNEQPWHSSKSFKNVILHKGWFDKTLPLFFKNQKEKYQLCILIVTFIPPLNRFLIIVKTDSGIKLYLMSI